MCVRAGPSCVEGASRPKKQSVPMVTIALLLRLEVKPGKEADVARDSPCQQHES